MRALSLAVVLLGAALVAPQPACAKIKGADQVKEMLDEEKTEAEARSAKARAESAKIKQIDDNLNFIHEAVKNKDRIVSDSRYRNDVITAIKYIEDNMSVLNDNGRESAMTYIQRVKSLLKL